MIVSLFQDRESIPIVVCNHLGETIDRGPEPGVDGRTVDVPSNAEGDSTAMSMLSDLDEEWQAVHISAGSFGRVQVNVYSPDPSVVFIRIGSGVIAVHTGPNKEEGRLPDPPRAA